MVLVERALLVRDLKAETLRLQTKAGVIRVQVVVAVRKGKVLTAIVSRLQTQQRRGVKGYSTLLQVLRPITLLAVRVPDCTQQVVQTELAVRLLAEMQSQAQVLAVAGEEMAAAGQEAGA
jgi:hypothetical protein